MGTLTMALPPMPWRHWWAPTPEEWSALAALIGIPIAVVGVVVGGGALLIAWVQLREVVRSNRDVIAANEASALASRDNAAAQLAVSRPYVTVDFEPRSELRREPSTPLTGVLRIVVRNDGRSPATGIRVTFEPELEARHLHWRDPETSPIEHHARLRRWFGGEQELPSLRPGREYAMLFDRLPEVYNDRTNQRQYRATVTYTTIDGEHSFSDSFDLDIDALSSSYIDGDRLTRISKDIQHLRSLLDKRL